MDISKGNNDVRCTRNTDNALVADGGGGTIYNVIKSQQPQQHNTSIKT